MLLLVPQYVRSDNAQALVPGQAGLQASAPTCRNALQALNVQGLQHVQEMLPLSRGNPAQPQVLWNWSANPSAEMAVMTAPVSVAMDKDVPLVLQDLELPVLVACQGCVSRWPPVSSCSSKSRITDRQRHRRDVLMALLSQRAAVRLPLEEPRPPRLFHVQQLPHHQHQGVQASDLVQELVVNAGLDGLTGMTAPNWRRYVVNHLKNSVKKSISSAKTMMP